MKKIKSLAIAIPVVAASVLMFAGTAQAEGPETRTVELKITDRPDSGFGEPNIWAKDTFDRKVTATGGPNYWMAPGEEAFGIEAVPEDTGTTLCDQVETNGWLWKYEVKVEDSGTFVTDNNSATGSPGKAAQLKANATGTFKGGAVGVVYAPAHWCSFTGEDWDKTTKPGTETGATGEFLVKLFDAKVELTDWGWTYERCANTTGYERWINADGLQKGSDAAGDITGADCPASPSPSETPSSSAPPVSTGGNLPITGMNIAVMGTAGAGFIAVGLVALLWGMHRRRETE